MSSKVKVYDECLLLDGRGAASSRPPFSRLDNSLHHRSMRPVVCKVRVSKVTCAVVRYGPAEHTWYEQQESSEDIQISLQGKKRRKNTQYKHSVQW